jgi:hypothetical protein
LADVPERERTIQAQRQAQTQAQTQAQAQAQTQAQMQAQIVPPDDLENVVKTILDCAPD